MSKENVLKNVFKNGGFPPIKFCPEKKEQTGEKGRFFANTKKNDINIRQILTTKTKSGPIIIEDNKEDELEIGDV